MQQRQAAPGQIAVNAYDRARVMLGGGAFAGHIAAAMPQRITSWHMLAAIAQAKGGA